MRMELLDALTATPASVSMRRRPSICCEIWFDRFCSRMFRSRRRTAGVAPPPRLPLPPLSESSKASSLDDVADAQGDADDAPDEKTWPGRAARRLGAAKASS